MRQAWARLVLLRVVLLSLHCTTSFLIFNSVYCPKQTPETAWHVGPQTQLRFNLRDFGQLTLPKPFCGSKATVWVAFKEVLGQFAHNVSD